MIENIKPFSVVTKSQSRAQYWEKQLTNLKVKFYKETSGILFIKYTFKFNVTNENIGEVCNALLLPQELVEYRYTE